MSWWLRRSVIAGLLNALVWILPPPVHFIAVLMPLVSGYAIGARRTSKPLAWLKIGLVMGLTLGGVATVVGLVGLTVGGALFRIDYPPTYRYWVMAIGAGIGAYTALAGYVGAFVGMRWGERLTPGAAKTGPRVESVAAASLTT